jgi:hypothetical protein
MCDIQAYLVRGGNSSGCRKGRDEPSAARNFALLQGAARYPNDLTEIIGWISVQTRSKHNCNNHQVL